MASPMPTTATSGPKTSSLIFTRASATFSLTKSSNTNEFTNVDDDLECQDWIELYNPTNATIVLCDTLTNPANPTKWYLSDRSGSNSRKKWSFPEGTKIASGEFLVVWASGKNRGGVEDRNGNDFLDPGEDLPNLQVYNGELDPPMAIHTNFSLGAGDPAIPSDPEGIFLTNTAGTIVDRFEVGNALNSPTFSTQRTDVSFGRYPTPEGLVSGYLLVPTPGPSTVLGPEGRHNGPGALGFTDPPSFDENSSAPGLYSDTSVISKIIPPGSGGLVHVTFNCASPSRYSEIYRLPIETDHTLVVRAVAAKPGYYPSSSITRSFLFREDILGTAPAGTLPTDHQGARDATTGEFQGYLYGYPEASEDPGFPLLYKMNPSVIRDFKPTLETELSAVPIVSIVSDVSDLFDSTSAGLYPNSAKTSPAGGLEADPRSRDWQRLCSFEWMEEDGSDSKQANACLEMSGDTSVLQQVSRKHNFKLRFHSSHGLDEINYKLFDDSPALRFTGFGLKNPTQDSWAQHSGIAPLRPNTFNWAIYTQAATYCGEGWLRSAHRLMGHPGPHRRWVHLFLNGIYWGPYELTERVDDDYLERYSTIFGDLEYDVLKELGSHEVEAPDEDEIPAASRVRDFENKVRAIDGYTAGWTSLIADCTRLYNAVSAGSSLQVQDTLYNQILTQIDIDNYIDYLLCYSFSAATDWPNKNYRIGRRSDGGDRRFRFYVWDAELSFAPGGNRGSELAENWVRIILESGLGVAKPHQLLCLYSRYRQRFAERISYHFFEQLAVPGSGCLAFTPSGDRADQLFQDEMADFQSVLYSESARWGDSRKNTPFTFSDPSYLPGDIRKGDWQRTTNYILNTWLPQRRRVVFDHLAGHDLYVAVKTADVDDVTIPGERSLVELLDPPQVGIPYSHTFGFIGGVGPYTLSLASGTFPPGLSLSGNILSGIPTTSGTSRFTLKAVSSDAVLGTPRPLEGLTQISLTTQP